MLHDLRYGRATVSITLDTYSHAVPAMQEAAALIGGWCSRRRRPRRCSAEGQDMDVAVGESVRGAGVALQA